MQPFALVTLALIKQRNVPDQRRLPHQR